MSADNWEICPRCLKRAQTAAEKLKTLVDEAYSVIPEELQPFLVAKTDDVNEEEYRTLREDYEFYVDGVVLNISYSGVCTVCQLAKHYNATSPIEGLDK